jgi:hypothetical protein
MPEAEDRGATVNASIRGRLITLSVNGTARATANSSTFATATRTWV